MHMFIIFLLKTITKQYPTCCHVMALCHEDKQILCFKCNHGTCDVADMKCKYCNVIKLSKIMHQKHQIYYAKTLQREASIICR